MGAKSVNGAVCWLAGMRVDADGCPRAYAAPGSGLRGLDALGNAGAPGDWFGVVTDDGKPTGRPIVQPSGFLLSPSSLVDHTKAAHDPARYVDAERVPYVSIPREMLVSFGGPIHLGDLCVVFYRGRAVGGIVADVGPRGKYGEASIAMAAAHHIPSSPRNGGVERGVLYVIFNGSAASPAWPRAVEEFSAAALERFSTWGGADFAARVSRNPKMAA